MLPTIFSLGPVTLYSYGLCVAVGFLLAVYVIWKKAGEANLEEGALFDLIFGVTLYGLVGARLYYIGLHWSGFGFNFWKWILFLRYPGLAFHGALMMGLFGLWREVKKRKWDFWLVADIVVQGLVLGQAVGRLGCFLNGCCYGLPTSSFLGVVFPGSLEKRLPIQLLEAILFLMIFVILGRVGRRYRFFTWYKGKKDEAQPGLTFSLYLLLTGVARFLTEFLRDDSVYWWGWRSAQIWSLAMFLMALVLIYLRSGREFEDDKRALAKSFKNWKMKIRRENGRN